MMILTVAVFVFAILVVAVGVSFWIDRLAEQHDNADGQ